MPSLRELLWDVREYGAISRPAYALLKALVEIAEPEKHTCGDCNFFHTGCAEWCVVRGASAKDCACEHFVAWVESEDTELAEAKAETERLETECLRQAMWCRKAEESVAKIRADAEIGRLVRGMPNDTALRHRYGTYRIARFGYIERCRLGWTGGAGSTDDPAEALRAIQEVGDGEA